MMVAKSFKASMFQKEKVLFRQIQVVYICSSFWLLAVESRDLSQAEKKVIVVKREPIHKMTISLNYLTFHTN